MTINVAIQISCPPDKEAVVSVSNNSTPTVMKNGDVKEFTICRINSLNIVERDAPVIIDGESSKVENEE